MRFIGQRTTDQLAKRVQKYSRGFEWIDPNAGILGTKPEKIVYAELQRRHIPFDFQAWLHINNVDLEVDKWYRPDFLLPEYKIIIQIQGAYFHSQPARIESDSIIASLYESQGYKVLFWWDYDIEGGRLDDLFRAEPALQFASILGPPRLKASKQIDDLKGLRKMNSRKRKPWTKPPVTLKVKGKGRRKVKGVFEAK